MGPESLSFMVEQQVKKLTGRKTKETDVHMVNNAPERPSGTTSAYAAVATRPYQQQVNPTQVPNRAFNQRGRPDSPRPFMRENQKYIVLPMSMTDLYAYLLDRKLVTLLFAKP